MAKRPEETFEERLKVRLEAKGWTVGHCESINRPGWPDMTCGKNKHLLFIETKVGAEVRPAQKTFAIDFHRNSNGTVWGVRSSKLGYKLFKLYDYLYYKEKEIPIQIFCNIETLVEYLDKVGCPIVSKLIR